ncbi:DNA cytosine methyltransferase [Arthrobacter sp. Sa2BUA2]|uniref:Cytosine-specific methyltransferase n=1 Tax=Arthrobacter pullicola TaxID=2762224 RepID=A0ABR8YGM6_9MICC|nr:DNA cytosine methyltransferase [Arthrobacter pullicola]MBD8043363.1 DNA cytosine methyltransferase [Arthrobacter pullicola]
MQRKVPGSPAPYTMIDLFAGAGGLSEGLRESGFTSLYANEVVQRYSETFKANHPEVFVDNRDVRRVDAAEVREQLGLTRGELSLVAGGPPCQGFSVNAPVRSNDDYRNHLFREFLRFVDEFMPAAVLIENVPGLVSFERGATLSAIIQALEELGYTADVRILYAPLYGVPQTRWRTIILGFRNGNPSRAFPQPTHIAPMRVNFTSTFRGQNIVAMPDGSDLIPYTSVRDAIGDLPPLINGELGEPLKGYAAPPQNPYQERLRSQSMGVRNHEAARLGQINLERLRHIPPGGNWTNIPIELLPAGMKRAHRSDHTKRYGRSLPEGLSSTILTKCDPHWGAYFHYSQDRIFTVREAARIQSFPDHYIFQGSRIEQYEQVGNAVPPMLAAAVGAGIREVIASEELSVAV